MPFSPNGDLTGYEVQFFVTDTQVRMLREIPKDRTFYVVEEEDKLGGPRNTFARVTTVHFIQYSEFYITCFDIQVRARTRAGPGQWSTEKSLGI